MPAADPIRSQHVLDAQTTRYDEFWTHRRSLRAMMRFDVRYRCKRMREVLDGLAIDTEDLDVLDVGFGSGAMLGALPRSCRVVGADVGQSAIDAALDNPDLQGFADARFVRVSETDPDDLPAGPFDLLISSHTLEHVPNDADAMASYYERLRPGGHLVLFVPIEEPDYIRFHLRNYSLQTVQQVVRDAGFELRFVEGSMFVNGHVWKIITIPSRRRWPVVRHLVDGLRLTTLSTLPYPLLKLCDEALYRLGVGPRQALVVARKPTDG